MKDTTRHTHFVPECHDDNSKLSEESSQLPRNNRMKTRLRFAACAVMAVCLATGLVRIASPQTSAPAQKTIQQEKAMTTHASGTFEVKLTPQNDNPEDGTLGRMLIDKQFHGDLEAVSKGQMLSAVTAVKGSAGYVAIEKVSGTLQGRKGTFVLQHNGTMTRGEPQLSVTVVPDSGTDQLTGITGKMTIIIADGRHSYNFEYTLAKTP